MRNDLLKMLGEGMVKNSAELGFGLMPDTAVYEGDTWTKNLTQLSDIKLNVAGSYTLTSIDGNIADIDAVADIKDNDNNVSLLVKKMPIIRPT